MEKNSKIFVAGGTGLVGSAIIKNLLSKGYTNIISNYHIRKPVVDGVDYYPLDLTKQQQVEYFFETFQPAYVFFAAAKVGGIVANNTYRAEFIYSNLVIQNNLIDISYKNKVKKLLFLGSTCIYPKNCPQPMKEEYLLTDTLEYTNEPYAIAKIAGIKMCESYNLQYGTNFISVMPTNLYGPNDNFDLETSHVLPAIMRKIHEAKISNAPRVEIWGSGKPMREFLWSEDMADACVFLMENRDFEDTFSTTLGDEIRNTHINIGTGVEISIHDLAYMIREIVGYTGELYFNTDRPDGTMRKLTDVSKLHALGWKHTVELSEGISRLYQLYNANDDYDSL
jgi:GDP-L-fucose synthase